MSTSSTRLSTPLSSTSHNKSQSQSQSQQQHHTQNNNAAYNLLNKAHPSSPETANKIFTDKIAHKPLLLSTTNTEQHANSRTARRHLRLRKKGYALQHARPKPLSAKDKRALKLHDLQPAECRYEIYQGLNRLWRRYILEVLGYVDREGRVVAARTTAQPATSASSGGAVIASADFHGMEVEVVACVDPGRVGCRGIVVRETRSALVVVCDERETARRKLRGNVDGKDVVALKRENGEGAVRRGRDKVRMILKRGAVFRVAVDLPTKEETEGQVEVGGQSAMETMTTTTTNTTTSTTSIASVPKRQLVFELHGDQLEIRPVERAVKKFKWKPVDYL